VWWLTPVIPAIQEVEIGKNKPFRANLVNECNASTWEAEAGGWRIQGQPGLHGEILS
jgi:hypothetical protein